MFQLALALCFQFDFLEEIHVGKHHLFEFPEIKQVHQNGHGQGSEAP
jgi:hypothetical protein